MAFKSVNDYQEAKYAGKFVLQNNGDHESVVFLYRDESEVLVGEGVHYIKSNDYNGYVHCLGRGCPACSKGLRPQTKVFIPLYLPAQDKIVFWERTQKFLPQLHQDVFKAYPDPCNYVFVVTRNGEPGSLDTRYHLEPKYKFSKSYDEVLAHFNYKFPDFYENICKSVDYDTLSEWVNSGPTRSTYGESAGLPEYKAIPRVSTTPSSLQQSLDSFDTVSESISGDDDSDFDIESPEIAEDPAW